MIKKILFLIIIISLLMIGVASADVCLGGSYGTWTAYGDGWISRSDICTVIKWNTSGTKAFIPDGNATSVDYVVVGGGGGGGYRLGGGGGGAGGFNESTMTGLTGAQVVIVGAGGTAATNATYSGANGENSSFGNATVNITSIYGSGGGTRAVIVVKGASTGGGGGPVPAGTTPSNVSSQELYGRMGGTGYNVSSTNYQGGGGGGYISNGTAAVTGRAGSGGAATKSNITGNTLVFAGGGGGGVYNNSAAARGLGGNNTSVTVGGSGSYRTTAATAANVSSGSGGGGSGSTGTPSDGASGSVYIRFVTPTPLTSFTANNTTGYSPMVVKFNDTSKNAPTSWNWSFTNLTGNATEVWFSQLQNVTYTFGNGNWSIHLNATNANGTAQSTQSTIINVSTKPPNANFTMSNKTGIGPLVVNFTDNSTYSPTNWNWSFGDGNYSNSQNPTYIYNYLGNYTVILNASNGGGSNSITKYVEVFLCDETGYNEWSVDGSSWVKNNSVCTIRMWNTSLSTTWTATTETSNIEYLVIAGGGGGGGIKSYSVGPGGGGAGGLLTGIYTTSYGKVYNITVGAGGVAGGGGGYYGGNGTNSSFANYTAGDGINAKGGGGGAATTVATPSRGSAGGSGGGSAYSNNGGLNISGQGFAGGGGDAASAMGGGGGGGAGVKGQNGTLTISGIGGNGTTSNITGCVTYYAGGGGAGSGGSDTNVSGGLGGGGRGGGDDPLLYGPGKNGTYYGGGGGGGTSAAFGNPDEPGGYGYSGVVIIRYITPPPPSPPNSSFTANQTSGTAPLPVMFNDTSTNTPTAWNWSFTNLTGNATEVWFSQTNNVTYTFGVGNFSIKLNASNSGGWNNSTQSTIINVSDTSILYNTWTLIETGHYIMYNETNITLEMWNQSGSYNWTAPSNLTISNYVVVGGGGGGGGSGIGSHSGSGGGSGGVLAGSNFAIVNITNITVIVGAGGAGGASGGAIGSNGGNSTFGTSSSNITASGGGAGATYTTVGANGGSGGGGSYNKVAGSGISGQGFKGGNLTDPTYSTAGGGGGNQSIGGNGTTNVGGAGGACYVTTIIPLVSMNLSGGGGGGTYTGGVAGGAGGCPDSGGNGGLSNTVLGTVGINGTGGGGGAAGSSTTARAGFSGGSGIVIIKYLTNGSSSPSSIPIVQWTLNKKMVRAPVGIIIVNDTSLNTPTSWDWYWGDGTANSTTNNTTHKYTKRGVYEITLNASNAAGSNISASQQVRSFGYEIYVY